MSEWERFTIGEIGELFDGPHATPTRIEKGPYFLNISSLNQGRLNLEESDHVSEEHFVKWTRRVTPTEGDLLFSYETRLGEAALMPANVRACLGRRMALIRPNGAIIDPHFLLYFYLSPSFQRTIERNTIHGATVNRIALKSMPQWEIQVPPLPEQQAIAEVLGALDDKIAANTNLQSISWALAEGEFVQVSRLGTAETTVGDLLSLEYGKPLPAINREPGSTSVVGSGGVVGWHSTPFIPESGVVVGRKGTAGAVHWIDGPHWPIDTTFYAVPKSSAVSSIYAYFLLRSLRLNEMNGDSAVPGLNRNEAHAIKTRQPVSAATESFSRRAEDLVAASSQAAIESRTLAATRDALLPQLMSGKLRVRDAEQLASGVL